MSYLTASQGERDSRKADTQERVVSLKSFLCLQAVETILKHSDKTRTVVEFTLWFKQLRRDT